MQNSDAKYILCYGNTKNRRPNFKHLFTHMLFNKFKHLFLHTLFNNTVACAEGVYSTNKSV